MAVYKTKSEKILDRLADGETMDDLRESGYDRIDILTAALFGVAELHEEYKNLAAKHNMLQDFNW